MIQKRGLAKSFILIITLGVLITLILSAPAQAYILKLDSSNTSVQKGEKVNFVGSVQKEMNDRANITSLEFILEGPLKIICKFKLDGEIISGCNGITIQVTSTCTDPGYGYTNCNNESGYGYGGYGNSNELLYNITYDTGKYFAGKYTPSFVVKSGNSVLNSKLGEELVVSPGSIPGAQKSCSIRAKDGTAIINGESFGNKNKINFYIPLKGARKGTGYINGQKGRTTFSYNFKVVDIIEQDVNHTAISVVGDYTIGVGKKTQESAVIVLDKVSNMINVTGADINIKYMNINFKTAGC